MSSLVIPYAQHVTRRHNHSLVKITLLLPEHEKVYAYTREWEGEKMLVVLNFSSDIVTLPVPVEEELEDLLLNNLPQVYYKDRVFSLEPWQALVFKLSAPKGGS